jgi:hypothetical protein
MSYGDVSNESAATILTTTTTTRLRPTRCRQHRQCFTKQGAPTRRARTRTRHLNAPLRTPRERAGLGQARIQGAAVRHL